MVELIHECGEVVAAEGGILTNPVWPRRGRIREIGSAVQHWVAVPRLLQMKFLFNGFDDVMNFPIAFDQKVMDTMAKSVGHSSVVT